MDCLVCNLSDDERQILGWILFTALATLSILVLSA